MKIKTLKEIKNISGKTILVRSDFNVAIANGKIVESFKIIKGLETIKYLRAKGSKIILLSHLGRPKGYEKKYSLKPVFNFLKKEFKNNIYFVDINEKMLGNQKLIDKTRKNIEVKSKGSIILFENVRFISGEEKNDQKVAKFFASFGDLFVVDGFAVAHRQSASVTGIAKFLPVCAGLLMEEEIKGLSKFLEKPKKPFVAVVGGNKMETKLPMIKKLLPRASQILIGGGIANTFLLAQKYALGDSIAEKKEINNALALLKNKKIILPIDYVVGTKLGKKTKVVEIKKNKLIASSGLGVYDIGPKTISLFAKYIKKANTLVWNGAVGMFEVSAFSWGSKSIARLFASRSKGHAFGSAGGGETVEIINKLNLFKDIDLVSTGGGAMLSFLSGEKMPGIEILKK